MNNDLIVNVHAHSVRDYVAITDSAPGTPKVTGIKVLQTLFKVLQITINIFKHCLAFMLLV